MQDHELYRRILGIEAPWSTAFELEMYPGDFLTVGELSEIAPVDPDGLGRIWRRDEIEELLEETTA